jgi:hypothetical protein
MPSRTGSSGGVGSGTPGLEEIRRGLEVFEQVRIAAVKRSLQEAPCLGSCPQDRAIAIGLGRAVAYLTFADGLEIAG